MKLKNIFLLLILLILITGSTIVWVSYLDCSEKTSKKEIPNNAGYKMIKFEIEEKPPKVTPYKQKTDSIRYVKHIYEYFEKIEKARERSIKK